jgi:two-component system KDP operon response regulator KdpE
MLGGKMLHLTPIEFAILCTLMQRAGQLVTYQELMQSVWGNSGESDSSVLRVNISRLRQKIEDDADRPRYILTVPRQGYRMPG